MILAIAIGVLTAGAVYLMLQKDRFRVILGFVILSHAVNLLLFSAGGNDRRGEPLGSNPDLATTADPLPQAFVLTAIVIAFAISIYLLVLAVTGSREEDAAVDAADGDAPDGDTASATNAPERTQAATAPAPTGEVAR